MSVVFAPLTAPPAKLDLVALEVSLVLHDLDERLQEMRQRFSITERKR
jgi:hypothetical protein